MVHCYVRPVLVGEAGMRNRLRGKCGAKAVPGRQLKVRLGLIRLLPRFRQAHEWRQRTKPRADDGAASNESLIRVALFPQLHQTNAEDPRAASLHNSAAGPSFMTLQ